MGPKKYKDGGVIEASSTTESLVNDMFGKGRVDFQNIPIPSTQREITGDTTEDIISEILKQLDLDWQLPVKNAEDLNEVLAQKLEGQMRTQFEYICKFWGLLLQYFTFDDLNEESYKKLFSFALSKKNTPLYDSCDELGGLNSAILDIARVELFLFKYPQSPIVSHSAWRNLYHALADACVRSVRRSFFFDFDKPCSACADGEEKISPDPHDHMLSAPVICYNGECKFEVKMIIEDDAKQSPQTEMPFPSSTPDPGTSETSAGIEKERSLRVRAVPDLTIYSMDQCPELIETIPILVIEVKTSKQVQLNQVEYVDKTPDGTSKETMTGGGDSNCSLEFGDGDAGQVRRKRNISSSSSLSKKDIAKSKRLECVKTQHFFELLGPLKDGELKTVENRGTLPKKPIKMFGCYIIKNKIHLTALRVTTARGVPTNTNRLMGDTDFIRHFIGLNTTKEYVETDKRVQFKYTCTDYLDLFNLEHFTVFMKWLYFIVLTANKAIEK